FFSVVQRCGEFLMRGRKENWDMCRLQLICGVLVLSACAPDWNGALDKFRASQGNGGLDGGADGGVPTHLSLDVPGDLIQQSCSPAPFVVTALEADGGISTRVSEVQVTLSANLQFCGSTGSTLPLTAGQAQFHVMGSDVGTGAVT